ncbi:MAG: MiaB/RimO family radical SAM methylthiotransferase [Alphaproteobacteria bacterium]|nr:MiaB/RimO family radical SAM methylthiotransferase [Alphaproteobacteria bacterium]
MKNQEINFISLGCRLNALEAEKIKAMLMKAGLSRAIIVNTCTVTKEAERQSKQAIRKLARENPGTMLFVTGCAATRAPDDFRAIDGVTRVIINKDKMDIKAYGIDCDVIPPLLSSHSSLSKGFVQIQNGCNHSCAYCIVSRLRGRNVSFPYEQILAQTGALTDNGYGEIVLTGVDIAGYSWQDDNKFGLSGLCNKLLADIPTLRRLRLSSLDPGTDLRPLADMMRENMRMMPHMHLSMQSGSDAILYRMGRRHNAQMVRDLMKYADNVSFSWDLICGFPGETKEYFDETCALINELKPIRLHVFPFSPRPGTPAATMPNQIDTAESKRRVRIVTELTRTNMLEFMREQVGRTVSVLIEKNNIARDTHDVPIKIVNNGGRGEIIPARSIIDVKLIDIEPDKEPRFIAEAV